MAEHNATINLDVKGGDNVGREINNTAAAYRKLEDVSIKSAKELANLSKQEIADLRIKIQLKKEYATIDFQNEKEQSRRDYEQSLSNASTPGQVFGIKEDYRKEQSAFRDKTLNIRKTALDERAFLNKAKNKLPVIGTKFDNDRTSNQVARALQMGTQQGGGLAEGAASMMGGGVVAGAVIAVVSKVAEIVQKIFIDNPVENRRAFEMARNKYYGKINLDANIVTQAQQFWPINFKSEAALDKEQMTKAVESYESFLPNAEKYGALSGGGWKSAFGIGGGLESVGINKSDYLAGRIASIKRFGTKLLFEKEILRSQLYNKAYGLGEGNIGNMQQLMFRNYRSGNTLDVIGKLKGNLRDDQLPYLSEYVQMNNDISNKDYAFTGSTNMISMANTIGKHSGGVFANDPKLMESLLNTVGGAMQTGRNPAMKAMQMSILAKLNPGSSYTDLMMKMEKPFEQKGYEEELMSILNNPHLSKNQRRLNIKEGFGFSSYSMADEYINAQGKNKSFTGYGGTEKITDASLLAEAAKNINPMTVDNKIRDNMWLDLGEKLMTILMQIASNTGKSAEAAMVGVTLGAGGAVIVPKGNLDKPETIKWLISNTHMPEDEIGNMSRKISDGVQTITIHPGTNGGGYWSEGTSQTRHNYKN